MIDIPNVENKQLYDESLRADKLSWTIHSFSTRKEKKGKKKINLGFKGKTKHSREISDDSNDDDEF
jgi:hypothetical protein